MRIILHQNTLITMILQRTLAVADYFMAKIMAMFGNGNTTT